MAEVSHRAHQWQTVADRRTDVAAALLSGAVRLHGMLLLLMLCIVAGASLPLLCSWYLILVLRLHMYDLFELEFLS